MRLLNTGTTENQNDDLKKQVFASWETIRFFQFGLKMGFQINNFSYVGENWNTVFDMESTLQSFTVESDMMLAETNANKQ